MSQVQEGTRRVNGTCAVGGLRVTADGTGLASHAGSLLLAEMADRSGLTAGVVGGDGPYP